MTVCTWLDAGRAVGGGHSVRCAVLARRLVEAHGLEMVAFAPDPAAVRRAVGSALRIEALSTDPGAVGFAEACRKVGARLAIIDLPHTRPADPAELAALGQQGVPRLLFDTSGDAQGELLVNACADPSAAGGGHEVVRRSERPGHEVDRRSESLGHEVDRRSRDRARPRRLLGPRGPTRRADG